MVEDPCRHTVDVGYKLADHVHGGLNADLLDVRIHLAFGVLILAEIATNPLAHQLVDRTDRLAWMQREAAHRGLGLALAKIGKLVEARPHLEAAAAAEPSALTSGYLALCTARLGEGDPAKNLSDGLAQLTKHQVRNDAAWARLAADLFAAAKLAGVTPSPAAANELAAIPTLVVAVRPSDGIRMKPATSAPTAAPVVLTA